MICGKSVAVCIAQIQIEHLCVLFARVPENQCSGILFAGLRLRRDGHGVGADSQADRADVPFLGNCQHALLDLGSGCIADRIGQLGGLCTLIEGAVYRVDLFGDLIGAVRSGLTEIGCIKCDCGNTIRVAARNRDLRSRSAVGEIGSRRNRDGLRLIDSLDLFAERNGAQRDRSTEQKRQQGAGALLSRQKHDSQCAGSDAHCDSSPLTLCIAGLRQLGHAAAAVGLIGCVRSRLFRSRFCGNVIGLGVVGTKRQLDARVLCHFEKAGQRSVQLQIADLIAADILRLDIKGDALTLCVCSLLRHDAELHLVCGICCHRHQGRTHRSAEQHCNLSAFSVQSVFLLKMILFRGNILILLPLPSNIIIISCFYTKCNFFTVICDEHTKKRRIICFFE